MARLLIVDDEEPVRTVMGRWLSGGDHVIVKASSAEAALEAMAQEPADVVFADIQMPGHGGLWMTAELRRLYPSTAVILATGVSTIGPRVSMQDGVLAYLVKPFTQDALLHALAEALRWRATAAGRERTRLTEADLQAWLDSLA
jgi:DNA-binding NtrC family response regulator